MARLRLLLINPQAIDLWQIQSTFLPRRQADVLAFATQMHVNITADGFDPAALGLTSTDVSELGELLESAQSLKSAADAARMEVKAHTKALSRPNGAHERLVAKVRAIANVVRASNAPADAIAALGVRRKKLRGTLRPAPSAAPEFSVDGMEVGVIRLRFRTAGSAQPRARTANAIGVQVAVLDAARSPVDNEADTVPTLFLSSSPATLDSTRMPRKVRLYAHWITQRGLTGPWSLPLPVSLI